MADERKIGAVEIDRLYDFLDGLQASGYTIDPRQYLALSDLLMAVIARGDSLDELPLKTMIAPLICSTPVEQQDFYQRFDRWYPTLLPVKQASLSGDGIALPPPPIRRWSLPTINRTAVIWVMVVVAVIALIVWLISNSAVTGTQVINSTVSLYGAIFAIFGFMVWLGWRTSILYQENQYITREIANQEPVYTKVPVKAYIQDVMPVMQFKPIVSSLRKRTQVPSSEVDVGRTIENALNHNNWLEIIYRQRQVMPEYVVLIDRKSHLDQQARFVQEVLAKLAADGVWLHQYEFSGDPRICFPLDQKDIPLRLKDLQARHPDSRLLIFSGNNELINPLTGLLQDWLESLSYWQERAILTPDKLQKVLLEELQTRDFAVLPMTFDGLASLVRAFETDNVPLLTNGGVGLPAQLIERPMRWTGRDTLPETEVKALVDDIKNYLGENGFYWLCATAVYPELRWELTLHLGSALKDESGQPLLNPDLLLRLARLPWFRFGYMPDWIRSELIENFTSKQENCTHDILGELLASAYKGQGFDIVFARKSNDSIQVRTQRFLNALVRNVVSDSAFRDYVFVKFITKPRLKKLAIQLPKILSAGNLSNIFGMYQNLSKPNKSKGSIEILIVLLKGFLTYYLNLWGLLSIGISFVPLYTLISPPVLYPSEIQLITTLCCLFIVLFEYTSQSKETREVKKRKALYNSYGGVLASALYIGVRYFNLTFIPFSDFFSSIAYIALFLLFANSLALMTATEGQSHKKESEISKISSNQSISYSNLQKRPLKVYLCHSHADREVVRLLYTRLTNEGIDAWLDKEKLLPGQDWELEIRKAVREADVVVVCLSKQFTQAGFQQKEVRLVLDIAMEKPGDEVFIIPARLEECDNLEILRKWHWVDLFEVGGFQRLLLALRVRADKIGAKMPSIPIKKTFETSDSRINGIFIAYSRKDLSFAEQLAADLKNSGFNVWRDVSSLGGGTRWRVEIEKAIRNSQFFIVVLSPDSMASEWVEREFLFASQLGRKIIPLMYRSCELTLDYLDLNYIDLQEENYPQNFDKLLKVLRADDTATIWPASEVKKPPFKLKPEYIIAIISVIATIIAALLGSPLVLQQILTSISVASLTNIAGFAVVIVLALFAFARRNDILRSIRRFTDLDKGKNIPAMATHEKAARERVEQSALERSRKSEKPNYRSSTSLDTQELSQETEIAIWGPTASGKDWLLKGFARELMDFSKLDDEFSYELYEQIPGETQPVIVTPTPPASVPTANAEDYSFKFIRRHLNKQKSGLQSIFEHPIIFHNNRGVDLVSALMDPNRFDRTFVTLIQSPYILITLDAQIAQANERTNKIYIEDELSLAANSILSKEELTELLSVFLKSLAKSGIPSRHLAVCITKADTFASRGDPWSLLERAFGSDVSRLFNEYKRNFDIEVFITSAAGYIRKDNRMTPNFSNGKLIDPKYWSPVNCAVPFFWLFEKQEIEQIRRTSNLLNRNSNLQRYIPYPEPRSF